MSVTINHLQEIEYGLSIGTDLDDFERRNSPYFAFFTEFDRLSGRLYHSG